MTTFKTALTIATAVALGAAALISTSAFAKVLPSTHLQPGARDNFGAVTRTITTPGLPGTPGNSAPTRPSASPTPVPFCLLHPGACG